MKADQEDEPFDTIDGRDGWNRNEYVCRESVVVFPRTISRKPIATFQAPSIDRLTGTLAFALGTTIPK